MVGMAGQNRAGAIKLFEQHDAHELMRPGRGAERKGYVGALPQARSEAIGAAKDETDRRAVFIPPLAKQSRKAGAIERLTMLVQDNDDASFGKDIGDGDRFLDAPPLGVLRATFPNFDDLEITQSACASD